MLEVFINGKRYIQAKPEPTGTGFEQALECRMEYADDLGRVTIREYFHELLSRLWRQKKEFSGEEPLGNSEWETDVIYSLIAGGFVPGQIHEDDECITGADYDEVAANKYVAELINHCFFGDR
jgi:hypothetical protein